MADALWNTYCVAAVVLVACSVTVVVDCVCTAKVGALMAGNTTGGLGITPIGTTRRMLLLSSLHPDRPSRPARNVRLSSEATATH